MRTATFLSSIELFAAALTQNTEGNLSSLEIDDEEMGMNIAAWKVRIDDLIETLRSERAALEERKPGAAADESDRFMMRGAEIDRTLAVLETTVGRLNAADIEVVPLAADPRSELAGLAHSIDEKNRSPAGGEATMAFLQNVISGGRKITAALER